MSTEIYTATTHHTGTHSVATRKNTYLIENIISFGGFILVVEHRIQRFLSSQSTNITNIQHMDLSIGLPSPDNKLNCDQVFTEQQSLHHNGTVCMGLSVVRNGQGYKLMFLFPADDDLYL